MGNDLLRIEDLAKRWGVTIRQAKTAALEGDLRRIALRPRRKYVSWATTRFDVADVLAWEAERKEASTIPAEASPAPPTVKPLGGRPRVPNHLGRW